MYKFLFISLVLLLTSIHINVTKSMSSREYQCEKYSIKFDEPKALINSYIKTGNDGNIIQNIILKDESMYSHSAFTLSFKIIYCFLNRCYFWLREGRSALKSKLKKSVSHSEYISLLRYYNDDIVFNFEIGYVETLFSDEEKVYYKVYYHNSTTYHLYSKT
ncbi:hypothetical protein [Vibrio aestuarianus]|uniref:Uncharacterized protein n=1 Tax=Vibrio aestuarianus TaxID=28171 RepID=A0A9X4EWT0_9VIBR|nr:hypothetical protein [Vibrio aestuarianus]MDE1242882.1 hypothetical protein [Vibrio aestuarianus]MDE1265118.1 hypothetical protein [Vibrio aestuarianus]MDE1297046.1 hypothetical protein [Vibrio aestuarianus]